jgi:hypothetical protein
VTAQFIGQEISQVTGTMVTDHGTCALFLAIDLQLRFENRAESFDWPPNSAEDAC